ncbi:hypothetical protein BBO99_00002676 [Phytophthora kernoviae]|uniref:Uncharacterized protein n=2 Tax=Phytophthora kernoviae TaxID=325452 RepID=A0A421GWG2_9STRA|nr:hypothetical protein G195_003823 [Phytophthora kernoviae 00238/432]KAG2527968.1 hypothetical protein JM16_002401 [Phytophthora kernoviae]KAG2529392.1 hypothetical protein JM18_002808 [Phytophthora kernoviae]RLN36655.1 hypothetical protein BBI17_002685 [Phytophthora kernoviae]RLN82734.1 hypothetical protein BBO99_00002676 [Phytophthora kernoviae]
MVITREQAQEALLADHRSLFYMAGNPDVVEVFECEGSFSFLQEQHHFTFCIHADSSVRVDLKPLNVDTNDESVGFPIEEEQNSTGDNTTEQEGEEQETEENAKLLAYDGRAMVELQSEEQQEAQLVCYVVHFKIVQWGRGAQGMWSQIVKCIAHLSPEFGMSGRFVEIRENVEEAQEFVLRPVKHRVEPLENALHPLTPGYYELQGVTIAENAFVYECAVSLKLEANGMVSGTSRELPFSQECPLAANKSRFHLRISSDGSLHGEVRQKLQKPITAATNGKKRKRRVIADHPDGFVVAHVVGNAQVVPTEEAFVSTTTVGCDQDSAAEYCCAFEMLSGKWNNVDEGHAEGYEGGRGQFELELVRVDFSQITITTEKIENKKMNGAGVNKDDTMTSQCDSDQLQQASQQASGRDMDNAIVLNDDDADVIRKFTTGEYELSGRATDTDGKKGRYLASGNLLVSCIASSM